MSVTLGTAGSYAVLANQAITNTGFSVLTGNVGITPNGASSVTGFPPGTYTGTLNAANAAAVQAQADAQTAYNACIAATTTNTLSASTYATTGGQTLTAGVYSVGTGMTINGNLILSGTASSVFIFKIGSTLITASASSVTFSGPVNAANVFWQVGSSATLGTTTAFQGTILANTSITANNGATSTGGFLALGASVTLTANIISNAAVCYVKGTKILTSTGYKNIEDIVLGDEVCIFADITKDDKLIVNKSNGETTRKVIFGGYFTRSNLNIESKPVVFKAGSLGKNTPFEDVAVSPSHAIIVNNIMVSASHMINYDTIYQSDDYEEVTYYHIELESHSVINAGGLLSESLVSCRNKFTPI